MPKLDCECVVIGAGVAGLAAMSKLRAAGIDAVCLEAGNRVGGRIFTLHDPLAPLPIELGAEFIHGRPPEVWDLIRRANLPAFEHTARALHLERGAIVKQKEVGELAERVLEKMSKTARKRDLTFDDYLQHSRENSDVKAWARIHVEGFNAAHSDRISVASLVQDSDAADEIDGDRSFRILTGYGAIPIYLLQTIPDYQSAVKLNAAVERVQWKRGAVQVLYRSASDQHQGTLRCRYLVVTVSLGVLQAPAGASGAILIEPEPSRAVRAAASLDMGQVYRVTLRFRDAFWSEHDEWKQAGFLISRDPEFFAWWTTHPVIAPLLTGWSAGTAAAQFANCDAVQITARALASLGRILGRTRPTPEAAYFHDWSADPRFRGAYSYTPAGALAAREALAEPVEGTLFFAGEAAESKGHSGTVHGALASGYRAAERILKRR